MAHIRKFANTASVLAAVVFAVGSASCSSSPEPAGSDLSTSSTPNERESGTTESATTVAAPTVTADLEESTVPTPVDLQLPDSTPGPYPVGHTTLELAANGDAPALLADVWYPSDGTAGTAARYDLVPGVGVESSIAVSEVPVAEGQLPLVVYSHGSGSVRFSATFFTEILASHGYVVAAVDHPGDTLIDAYIRGGPPDDWGQAVRARVGDLERVIDALVDAAPPLTGTVTGEQVVLAGHSLGGAGVIATGGADDRIDAVIAMDPTWSVLDLTESDSATAPLLSLWGSSGTPSESRSVEADYGGPWYRVDLDMAPHDGFTDVCMYPPLVPEWLAAGAPAELEAYVADAVAEACSPLVMEPQRLHDLVVGYSLVFLDRVLGGDMDADALLRSAQPDTEFSTGAG